MTTTETFSQTFMRVLTARDAKQNIPFSFQVPAGIRQITFQFDYAPKIVNEINNLLTLTVFDPEGWRGEAHRHDDPAEMSIGENQASPGFLPGAIQAGNWTAVVNTHMIMPGTPCTLRLTIRGTHQPAEDSLHPNTSPGAAARQSAPHGPGWYRGDLHAHTLHSDAVWDVAGLVADARARGLDFVTLSDHNTISGLAEMDAARADDLLTLGGMELTTFRGHALALGLREWVDWRTSAGQPRQPGVRGMDTICREVTESTGLFTIAHPMAIGDPTCTGCDWHYPAVLPGPARAVEVWNSDWNSESNNENALNLAYGWLSQGYRLALTAGTDNHGQPGEMHYGFNVVYANDLSEQEIINAVRAGRLFLSAGPRLELTGEKGQQAAMMGGSLSTGGEDAGGDAPIRLAAHWAGSPPGAWLDWIVDGQTAERTAAEGEGSKSWVLPAGAAHWCLATLREPSGRMLALTNPIYLDGRS